MDPLAIVCKAFEATVTADQRDVSNREFTALVSAFDVVDSDGDVMVPGAFAAEVDAFARGKSLPVIWNHRHDDLDAHIGAVTAMAELAPGDDRLPAGLAATGGLWVKGVLDDDPHASKMHRLMRGGRITQFSFVALGGRAREATRDGRPVREIVEVSDLVEVGPTLRGVNTSAQLLTIKSHYRNQPTEQPNPGTQHRDLVAVTGADAARFAFFLSLH